MTIHIMDTVYIFLLIGSIISLFTLLGSLMLWGILRLLLVTDATFGRSLVIILVSGLVFTSCQTLFNDIIPRFLGQLIVFLCSYFVFYLLVTRYHYLSWGTVISAYVSLVCSILLFAALVMVLPMHSVVSPVVVSGQSMSPSYDDGEYLLMSSFRPDYTRGDVIIFSNPMRRDQFLIKRIVGLPGETVLVNEGAVFINGHKLIESYIPTSFQTTGMLFVTLGDRQYVVLGDNREYALDSRQFGPVSEDSIVGEIVYPKQQ